MALKDLINPFIVSVELLYPDRAANVNTSAETA